MWASRLATLLSLLCSTGICAQDGLSVDPQSGLIVDDDWELVRANCSACHSTQLVIQNRMSAANWVHTIRWMQEKHNLWDLGENEEKIVAYLDSHYGITEDAGSLPLRRSPLNQPPLDIEELSE